jgi:hypothetical protein
LQAGKAGLVEAAAPEGDGVALAVEFLGELAVAGPVGLGGAEEKAAAEGKGLGRGMGAGQGLKLVDWLVGEGQGQREREGHGSPPCQGTRANRASLFKMPARAGRVQENPPLARDLRNAVLASWFTEWTEL